MKESSIMVTKDGVVVNSDSLEDIALIAVAALCELRDNGIDVSNALNSLCQTLGVSAEVQDNDV